MWFETGRRTLLPNRTSVHEAGDINGDGLEDVVGLSTYDGTVLAYPGTPTGLGPAAKTVADGLIVGDEADQTRLFLVDLDGDDDLDVAAGCSWARNEGTLPFILQPAFCTEGRGVTAVGDVNGDGVLDAIVDSATASLVSFVESFAPVPLPDVDGARALADVTGDSVADLIVATREAVTVSPGEGGAAPSFGAPLVSPLGLDDDDVVVAVTPFLVDGDVALAISLTPPWQFRGAPTHLMRSAGEGLFGPSTALIAEGAVTDVTDMDGDGDDELLLAGGSVQLIDASNGGVVERSLTGLYAEHVAAVRLAPSGAPALVFPQVFGVEVIADALSLDDALAFSAQSTDNVVVLKGPNEAPLVVARLSGERFGIFEGGVLQQVVDSPHRHLTSVVAPDALEPTAFLLSTEGIARLDLSTEPPSLIPIVDIATGRALLAIDWDGDGAEELAVTTDESVVAFKVEPGAGLVILETIAADIGGVSHVGDLDGDGVEDLIEGNFLENKRVLLRRGNALEAVFLRGADGRGGGHRLRWRGRVADP